MHTEMIQYIWNVMTVSLMVGISKMLCDPVSETI